MNRTASLGQARVTFTCHVEGEYLLTKVNNMFYNQNALTRFQSMGITFSKIRKGENNTRTQDVYVTPTVNNNNTIIACRATSQEGPNVESEPAFLFIAGSSMREKE